MNGGEKEGEVSKQERQVSRKRDIAINSKYNKILTRMLKSEFTPTPNRPKLSLERRLVG